MKLGDGQFFRALNHFHFLGRQTWMNDNNYGLSETTEQATI